MSTEDDYNDQRGGQQQNQESYHPNQRIEYAPPQTTHDEYWEENTNGSDNSSAREEAARGAGHPLVMQEKKRNDIKVEESIDYKDAVLFVEYVGEYFIDTPWVYCSFVGILEQYQKGNFTSFDVFRECHEIFRGHTPLLASLSRFLPENFNQSAFSEQDDSASRIEKYRRFVEVFSDIKRKMEENGLSCRQFYCLCYDYSRGRVSFSDVMTYVENWVGDEKILEEFYLLLPLEETVPLLD
eukprot:Nk52_evm41s914 gene=Nk52_evmTU41s914